MKQCTECVELLYNNVKDGRLGANKLQLIIYLLSNSIPCCGQNTLTHEAYTTQSAMACSQEPV